MLKGLCFASSMALEVTRLNGPMRPRGVPHASGSLIESRAVEQLEQTDQYDQHCRDG